jgi:competence protein ComGC
MTDQAQPTEAQGEAPAPRQRTDPGLVVRLVIYALIVLVLAAIMIPNFVRARTVTCKNACVANLRQIDGAKQQWALEQKKKPHEVPTSDDVAAFLKNRTLPTCPGGGKYTMNAISVNPSCSLAEGPGRHSGHTL